MKAKCTSFEERETIRFDDDIVEMGRHKVPIEGTEEIGARMENGWEGIRDRIHSAVDGTAQRATQRTADRDNRIDRYRKLWFRRRKEAWLNAILLSTWFTLWSIITIFQELLQEVIYYWFFRCRRGKWISLNCYKKKRLPPGTAVVLLSLEHTCPLCTQRRSTWMKVSREQESPTTEENETLPQPTSLHLCQQSHWLHLRYTIQAHLAVTFDRIKTSFI